MTLAPDRIADYLAASWQQPVRVEGLARIPGGASRETYRFDAIVGGETRPLILRREAAKGLIDTASATEFRAYQSAAGVVPVPRAVALEPDGAALDRPFILMERIDGGEVASTFTRTPFGDHAAALGEEFFAAMGRLAAHDPAGTPLAAHAETPAPNACWRIALDYWDGVIAEDSVAPQPIVAAAIRRLRADPPPPAQRIAIVHGDFRSGNMMHDGAGRLLAMFDWEMAHLGDPLEDLGWALNPLWDHFEPGRACGMLPRDAAVAAWETASGLRADPAALDWWVLFNAVKGCAIWTSAYREYLDGGRTDPVLAISGWYTQRRQDEILAALLSGAPIEISPASPATSDVAHILTGTGLVTAGAAEAAGAVQPFLGATMMVAGLLALLAAQEAEQAAAWRRADIADMAALTGTTPPAITETATLTELDAHWATLAQAAIDHPDRDTRAFLDFHRDSAARRALTWPL